MEIEKHGVKVPVSETVRPASHTVRLMANSGRAVPSREGEDPLIGTPLVSTTAVRDPVTAISPVICGCGDSESPDSERRISKAELSVFKKVFVEMNNEIGEHGPDPTLPSLRSRPDSYNPPLKTTVTPRLESSRSKPPSDPRHIVLSPVSARATQSVINNVSPCRLSTKTVSPSSVPIITAYRIHKDGFLHDHDCREKARGSSVARVQPGNQMGGLLHEITLDTGFATLEQWKINNANLTLITTPGIEGTRIWRDEDGVLVNPPPTPSHNSGRSYQVKKWTNNGIMSDLANSNRVM
ncbi:hypothetical protein J6590_068332 [Homalodisca vitripennis]|nr:hypothetical protein J6590_068332 [Homalodisca vitripennis]